MIGDNGPNCAIQSFFFENDMASFLSRNMKTKLITKNFDTLFALYFLKRRHSLEPQMWQEWGVTYLWLENLRDKAL